MKRHATLIVILSLLISLPAAADRRDRDRDRRDHGNRGRTPWAKVVRTTPVYESVRILTPVRECWTERVAYQSRSHRRHRGHHSRTPELLGATIGGLLGREIGHDRRDRRVATVLGAIIGGSVGRDIGRAGSRHDRRHRRNRNAVEYRNEERCETREQVAWEEQVVGYDVDYKYRGRIYRTRMDRDPGRRMKVAVDVRPAR